MNKKCCIRIAAPEFDQLFGHLFQDDRDEHGAVLLAGLSESQDDLILTVREVHPAADGTDYVDGQIGYRALDPQFIHKQITRARDERLVYLAVHNHPTTDSVGFSPIDIASHERGYPALLQIAKGMPVGAVVCGSNSMEADLWLEDHSRLSLTHATVQGNTIRRFYASPRVQMDEIPEESDRQIRMFGSKGQELLRKSHVGIIGLGGIGSLVAEYLSRLGIGRFTLVDDDVLEASNLSRVVGATRADSVGKTNKVGIAYRVIKEANESAEIIPIVDDVARESVAKRLVGCDYLFLTADSMRARLVFNAIVHQYLIPGVQLGAKVRSDEEGNLLDVMSAVRPVRPGAGCLWCNELIDPTALAIEAKSDRERKDQAYGVNEPNPSVITLNAVSASQAVNDFLLDFLGLRNNEELFFEHFHFLTRKRSRVKPRQDLDCTECSRFGKRFARGDSATLPCTEG